METHYIKTKIRTPKILLFFYLILNIIHLSISNINEEYNIQNKNNKLIENKNTGEKDIFFKLNNKFNFKDKDLLSTSKDLGENELTSNEIEFEYNKIKTIEKIKSFPLKLYCKIPKRNEKNENFIFNFNFIDYFDNKNLNFGNFIMIAIIIKESTFENIKKNKTNDEDIFNNKAINSKFDLSTKSVALKFNKSNFINEEEQLYLYAKIKNNNINISNLNLDGNILVINGDYHNYIIPKDNYINNKIYYDEKNKKNNYDLYHLQADSVDDIFSVDFCSNYALNRGIYVSFLDYNEKKDIQYNDISNNSTNINLMKTTTKKGKTYHFEFKLKNKKKDIIFCVFSKNELSELKSYNYIFKYNTNRSININYELNNEIKTSNNGEKTKIILDNIKIINNSITQYPKGEIYIRKIKNNNKKSREDLDTIGIIESKYELVNGIISYTNDNKKIEIDLPKINEKDYYSIFLNLPYMKEKFVYNTIDNHKIKRKYLYPILIFTGVPLYLGIVIAAIIYALKYKNSGLKAKILKTSFQEGVVDEDVRENEDNKLE